MKYQHLFSTTFAIILVCALLDGGGAYATQLEANHIRALAPSNLNQKFVGEAMQRAAFRQPDILPVYGSSEFKIQKTYQTRFRAVNLFQNEPTGFDVFPVGSSEATDIIQLQRLAGVGTGLQGKKVALSLSPTWFFERKQLPPGPYAGNFSHLQAYELVFSTHLSYALKRDAAKRMLDYPDTLVADPLLSFALHNLAENSWAGRLRYVASVPIGKLQTVIMRLQDHYEMLHFFDTNPNVAPINAPQTHALNWAKTFRAAQKVTAKETNNNRFGFDHADWLSHLAHLDKKHRIERHDKQFLAGLNNTDEWNDFALVLRELHELGAQTLVLSMPIAGHYYDYAGISPAARQVYYNRVQQLATRYGAQVQTFAKHDEDTQFVLDARSHLLPEGWIYYSEALNEFYHSQPLTDRYVPVPAAVKPQHHRSSHHA